MIDILFFSVVFVACVLVKMKLNRDQKKRDSDEYENIGTAV